ncbi:piggyBac transposable element-derived protein 3 [Trichonephila clavipes]|nr:piggyBac transposable element-derived protein 3 [Trichonephila clavipes]
MKITKNFVNPSSYTSYFYNFFTSIDLLKSLGEQGFRATGTSGLSNFMRKLDKPRVSVQESKSMWKKGRFTSNFAFDENSEIFLVRRNDNSTDTVPTNSSTLDSVFDVKRQIRGHKDKFNVKMTNFINV